MRRLLCVLLVACGSSTPNPGNGNDASTPDGASPLDSSAMDASSMMDASMMQGDAGMRWNPTQTDRFLYQLGSTTPDTSACVVPFTGGNCVKPTVWAFDLYANDGTTPNAAGVTSVHNVGGHAVCYVSGGSFENWRPDVGSFPQNVLGKVLDGWPNEKWLDVRQTNVLEPIMRARAQKCKTAGFDAMDWDNVDGYANDNGFGFTAQDQLAYNQLLAKIAHDLGMSVALKNDLDQIPQLVGFFDFAVNEQCAQYSECASLDPFTKAGKAVAQIEYTTMASAFCGPANTAGRSAAKMDLALMSMPWAPCR